ncbi:S-adenosylmethionine mitochondrial carrier protein [Trichoderma ghanense]|uniref:S-adenosylmethionine mitochondrial carrier protein n=1 Tax=Trichoderma ghanense TaxID=65468 RepID=A0ABY2GZ83_9HYPO
MKEIYLAGAAAAFTVDLLVYPLDTLKTRYQSQDFIKSPLTKPLALRGLYQGIGSVILATLPAAGVFFSTYETTKSIYTSHIPLSLPTPVIHSLASATAEMASCLVLTPGEVIKQNAQMIQQQQQQQQHLLGSTSHKSTSLMAFKRVLASGRLFTGYSALVARNLPFTALQFPLFEHIRARLWEHRSRTKGTMMQKTDREERGVGESGLIAGCSAAVAGSIAAFLTTPSDVIKTRMMVSVGDEASTSRKGLAGIKVVQDVWRERGLKGFFRGGAFRSAWTAVGSGLYLGMYDAAKLWLERRQ